MPGNIPIDAASSSVLVRLPLWPTANSVPPGLAVHGLGVVPRRRARRRVASVADGQVAAQAGDLVVVEDLGHQAHVLDDHHGGAVAHRHAGRLLAPVLEGIEAVEDDRGDGAPGREDPEHTALFPGAECSTGPLTSPFSTARVGGAAGEMGDRAALTWGR